MYRSFDQGETWTALSTDLTESTERGDVPYATMTTLAESPLKFEIVWAGTDDGQVWVTDSGGTRWNKVDDRLPSNRWVSRVEASRHERDRAYVSLNGYRDDDISAYLYATENLGQRWRDISANLPAEPINVIKEDPENADVLYVGTDRGVYVSVDRGEAWQALQAGLPNVPVHDLVVHPRERELVIGTHGRSIWIVDVLPIQELGEVQDQPLHVFHIDEVQAQRGWRSKPSEWFDRPSGDMESVIHIWSRQGGTAELAIVDEDDHVLYQATLELRSGINRHVWDLKVDPEAAAAAEADQEETEAASLTFSESIALGHPPYVRPGQYTVRVSLGDSAAEQGLTVSSAEPLKSRVGATNKIRGK